MTTLYVAKTGNDSTGNGSVGSPYKTINKALTVISAGTASSPNVIIVKNGTYDITAGEGVSGGSGIRVGKVTISKAWVTVQAETTHGAVFRGDWTPALLRTSGYYPAGCSFNWSRPYQMPDPADYGGAYQAIFSIEATGVTVDGFVIECVPGEGIEHVGGDHVTIKNNALYWTSGAINSISPAGNFGSESLFHEDVTILNNTTFFAGTCVLSPAWVCQNQGDSSDPHGARPDPAVGAIRMGSMHGPGLIKGNVLGFFLGEGFDIGKRCYGTAENPVIVEGNRIFNGRHGYGYVLHGRHVHVRGNVSYSTGGNPLYAFSPETGGNAYMVRDERQPRLPPSDHVYFYNNFGVNTGTNILIDKPRSTEYPAKTHLYIGFNTFVTGPLTDRFCVNLTSRDSGIFENNVCVRGAAWNGESFMRNPGSFVIRGNAYSHAPGGGYENGNNVINANLGLSNPNRTLVTTGWRPNNQANSFGYWESYADHIANVSDNFDEADYFISNTSPARNVAGARQAALGFTPPLYPFQLDFLERTRAAPDMGAYEAGGSATPSYTAAFSATPSATALDTGTAVSFINESQYANTTLTGYTWVVKKAGVTVATATTLNYNYTFTAADSYTVALTIATAAGSDTETVAYTITDPSGTPSVTAAFTREPAATTLPVGSTVVYTDTSVYQNTTFASRQWHMSTNGGAWVLSSTEAVYQTTYVSSDTFALRLTVTAANAMTDTETVTTTIVDVTEPSVTADFDSSDVDNVIDAGGSITFTDDSSVANTTISGRTWTVERGGQTVVTATTTDLTHAFQEPGTYIVRLRVDTAAGVFDIHEVVVTARVVGAGGYDFIAAPVRFAVATSTGTQTVTAAALGTTVPRAVLVRMTGGVTAGTAATGALRCEGAATDAEQWAHVMFSADAAAAGTARRRRTAGAVLVSIDGAGAVTGSASLLRFVAGGMELDVSDAFPSGYLVEAVFFAGSACEAWAGEALVGADGDTTAVTTGIAADFVYGVSSWAASADTSEADAQLSLGVATRDGPQAGFRRVDVNGRDPAVVTATHRPLIATARMEGGLFSAVSCGAFTTTGFSLEVTAGAINRSLSLLAIRTGGKRVALTTETLATGGPSSHALPFEAQTVIGLLSSMRTASTTTSTAPDATMLGSYTRSMHDSYESSLTTALQPAAATTSTRSLAADGLRAVGHDGTLLYNGAATINETSLDVTWTAAPGYAYLWLMLALEVGEEEEAPPDDVPIAAWTMQFEEVAGRTVVWFDSSTSSGGGEPITGWAWDFGDGTTSTEANPFHVYEVAGEYDVTLTITTADGDTATKTVEAAVTIETEITADTLVGPIPPLTSGGHTTNSYSPDGATYAVRLDPMGHFRALDADGLAAFLALEPDTLYALVAYDQAGHRFVIRETDGSVRYVATT